MEKYIFDLVVLVFVAVIVVVSAKKGFARTILDSASIAIGFFTAYKYASIISDFIYNKFISVFVEKTLTRIVENVGAGASVEEKIYAIIKTLPEGLIEFSKNIGVNMDSLVNSIILSDITSDELLVEAVTDKLIYGITDFILEFVFFVLLFSVVSISLRLVSSVFSKTIEKIPLVGTANYILGGVLGAVKSVFILFVLCSVGYLVAIGADIESNKFISDSYTYQYIIMNNPIIILIQG